MTGLPGSYSRGNAMDLGMECGMIEKYHQVINDPNGSTANSTGGKGAGCDPDLDALLANAGYTVKTSELAHVAQRLEQLESVLGAAQDAGITHLSSEAIHYNPSDLAGWIECMIEELAPNLAEVPTRKRSGELAFGQEGSSTLNSSIESGSLLTDENTQQGPVGTSQFPGMTFLEDVGELQQQQQLCNHRNDFQPIAGATESSTIQRDIDMSQFAILSGGMFLQNTSYSECGQDQLNVKHFVRPQPYDNELYHYQESFRQRSEFESTFPVAQGLIPRIPNGVYAQQSVMYADVDEVAQESGIRLVHLLLACAESVQRNDLATADKMVREIRRVASPQGGAMAKVAGYFVEALERRIYGVKFQDNTHCQADCLSELLYVQFYQTCPYLKFAHFTANQAILEAIAGYKEVHVIDFNLMTGSQWPAILQALALRPGGPPRFRLTGIGPPQPDGRDLLQETGTRLAQMADSIQVEFDFRGVVATKLDDVKPWMLQVRPGEAVVVNSIMQLHRLLYSEASRPPIDEVLESIRSLNPKIVTVIEQEANHNSSIFLDRFMQSLHYYSTMFDSLEACNLPPQSYQQLLVEMYLGREICNIVSCEGALRLERHETLSQWRVRMSNAGFRPRHLGSNAFKQASMLLTLFSGEGYTVEENNGCLTLGWHSRPLISTSAWQC